MEHISQKIVIGVIPVVTGKQPNAEDRKKLMAEEIREDSFEEAGRLVSQREAIREPNFVSRKEKQKEYLEMRKDNFDFEILNAKARLEKAESKLKAAQLKVKKVTENFEGTFVEEDVRVAMNELLFAYKVVVKAEYDLESLIIRKNMPANSKRRPAKLAKPKDVVSIKSLNKFEVYNSWENFEAEEAIEEELAKKGFETFYDVEARDLKGLKVGTVRVKTEKEISFVEKNTDFRSVRQSINNELIAKWQNCEKWDNKEMTKA